jgi:hypothetical protein
MARPWRFACLWCGRRGFADASAVYAHIAEQHPDRLPEAPSEPVATVQGAKSACGRGSAKARPESRTSCPFCGSSLAGLRQHAGVCRSSACRKRAQRERLKVLA